LPGKPKIFHGRDSQLSDILKQLRQSPARIAILGAGGIGKTSLAKAVVNHPEISAKHEHRFFVDCDSATTQIDLAALIGSHLGLQPGMDMTKPVVQYFSARPSALLILDNLETAWESMESRGGVEEFLSQLTDVSQLALMITMRGIERPAKVRWTRPFLPPLAPLSYDAARQTFIDIADDIHDSRDIDNLLNLTDNMPLAVDLIAHLVDCEGCPNVLARWEMEKTALLSQGYDRKSSLDASIELSLSSPRIMSFPGSKELLRLLSVLPDGLSDVELLQSGLPIQDILECKTTLLRTALAYSDDKRLKSLVPIREYIYGSYPPSPTLIEPLFNHFHSLLKLYRKFKGVQKSKVVKGIYANYANVQRILQLRLT
ncbi:P-loop containing nucleoside triphosphate hydrolase protein, partial [Mycena latifolia]